MGLSALIRKFGDPRGSKGKLSQSWYKANIVTIPVRYPMRIAWGNHAEVRLIPCHRLVADKFEQGLENVWNAARTRVKHRVGFDAHTSEEYDRLTLVELKAHGLDLFGGSLAFRLIRGGKSLSTHALGIALDIDPAHNPLGSSKHNIPMWAVEAFESAGFEWGGRWKNRPDPMHFEAH